MTEELWTLAELADRVAAALSSGYDGQQNRRITDVPDTRAIRYYTTIGLLDRPAEMRGRTALYHGRHLWQLVSIKRLQADGHSLTDIQAELAGASDQALQRLAALPDTPFWKRSPAPSTQADKAPTPPARITVPGLGARNQPTPSRAGAEPDPPANARPAHASPPSTRPPSAETEPTGPAGARPLSTKPTDTGPTGAEASPGFYQVVALDDGTLIMIPHRVLLDDQEIADIRTAARPLTHTLRRIARGNR